MSMTMLVPRLRLDERTATKLRSIASETGVGLAEVIAALIVRALAPAPKPDETLYRIVMAGERVGFGVGGPTTYPADWHRQGGLTHEKCREIAAGYLAWRRERNGEVGSREEET